MKNQNELEKIIENLCKGKDPSYKVFIKNIMKSMMDGEKWEKINKLNQLTENLKNGSDKKM
tara:strand:+ start:719 stop:901 length:183 start_codon:yes stop_codon:yes gene_type:complete